MICIEVLAPGLLEGTSLAIKADLDVIHAAIREAAYQAALRHRGPTLQVGTRHTKSEQLNLKDVCVYVIPVSSGHPVKVKIELLAMPERTPAWQTAVANAVAAATLKICEPTCGRVIVFTHVQDRGAGYCYLERKPDTVVPD